jgi:O-antigen ligase
MGAHSEINPNRPIFALLAFCIILTPNIPIPGFFAVRLEQLLLALFGLAVVIMWVSGKRLVLRSWAFPLWLAGFGVFMLIAIANGYRSGLPVVPNDFFEIAKPIMYPGFFIMASAVLVGKRDQLWGMQVVHGVLVVSALIALTQFFNPWNMNAYYVPWMAPTQYAALMEGYTWPRVIGMANNPNAYGFMAALGVMLGMILLKLQRNPMYMLTTVLMVTVLMMTRSRTAFVMLGVMLMVYIWLSLSRNRGRKGRISRLGGVLLALAGGIIFLTALLLLFPESLTWRFKEMFNLAESRSWQIRLRVWEEYFWMFMDHPLLGTGPVKAMPHRIPADNEWLFLLKRYGLVGTIYLVAVFWTWVNRSWQLLMGHPAGRLYVSLLVGAAVYMIPASVFHSYQLMALVMIMGALANASNLGPPGFEGSGGRG